MLKNSKNSLFGLPEEVKFCKNCVESNQRFMGSAQLNIKKDDTKEGVDFDDEGVCLSCRYFEKKEKFNWNDREKELKDILNKHRKSDGSYDILLPGSGGKDSQFLSYILKYKYKMNPLTITWAPNMYTDIGYKNFNTWISNGFDNILFTPNTKVHKKLTQLAFKNLLHPFQPFTIGQYNLAPKIALQYGIKLIVTGDAYVEKGVGGKIHKEKKTSSELYSIEKNKQTDIYFGGVHISELDKYGISKRDLNQYLPITKEKIEESGLERINLPHYINYNPQNNYYFCVEKMGFKPNPDGRSEGTYTKYSSLDDKIDCLHHYTWFIKTGRGRATDDAAIEIRNKIITRDEGVALVKKFDGEKPKKYLRDILNYLSLNETEFEEIIDKFRSPHLWEKIKGKWHLKHAVWK